MLKRIMALAAVAALASPAVAQQGRAAAQNRAEPPPIPRSLFISNMDTEFRKMDANHDGFLSKSEIEAYQTSQIIAAAEARKRALFAALDTDHNGVLSPDEFMRLPSNEPAPNGTATIQRFDANRDNRVSLIEYRAGTLANFDRLDTDHDGVVTAAEMRAGGIGGKNQ